MNPEMPQEQSTDAHSSSTLPLSGEKKPTYKIIAVLMLIGIIVIFNYFISHRHNVSAVGNNDEAFDIMTSNPVTKKEASDSSKNLKPPVDDIADKKRELAEVQAKDFIERLQVSQNASVGASGQSTVSATANHASAEESVSKTASIGSTLDPNTAFLLQVSNSKAEREYATHFGPLPYVIGQGKFIFATLAVAINSDLAGQIEAVVSQDIYGEQGHKILIPRGSHLIGQYRSGLSNNQSRLFTVWTRIKEPNGVDIQLGSEGTDTLGRAGLTGQVDYHFIDRFGSSLLVSLIGAGAANIGVNSTDQYNSSSAYRMGIVDAMSEQGKNLLNQNINIPPTINIAQGQKIVVFVNRDLDFSRVYR